MAAALENDGEWQQLDENNIEEIPKNMINDITDYADLPHSELPEFSDNPDFATDPELINQCIKNGEVYYETYKATLKEPARNTSHYEFNVTDDYFGEIDDYLDLDQPTEAVLVEKYVIHIEKLSYYLPPPVNIEACDEWNICVLNRWHQDNNLSLVYSIGSKTFQEIPGRPVVSGFFPILYKNSIYMTGNDSDDDLKYSSYRFDLEKREWTSFADCHRWNHSGCTHCNQMYIIGGCSAAGYLETVETFDFCSNKWQKERNLLSKRQFSGVATDDTCMYVCGGIQNGNHKLHCIEMYDPRDREGTSVNVDKNTVRGGCSAAIISNEVYISDELTGITDIFDKRFFKNIKTTRPESLSRNFLVAADKKIYQIQKKYIWEYNAADDLWKKIAKINYDAPIAIAYQKP